MTALEISSELYHRDALSDTPTLSASLANIICTQSPAHAQAAHPRLNPDYARQDEQKYDRGTVAHALLLQGLEVVHIVQADDWRTKAAKEERDFARTEGRVPLLAHQWDEVRALVNAAQDNLARLGVDLTAGTPERTLLWEMGRVACRARLDWLSDDASEILDIKTTGRTANPETWTRTLFSIGADLQHEWYRRGVEAMVGRKPSFTFIVIECEPPYAMSRVSLAPSAEEFANSKIDYALATWAACLESGQWPAYSDQIAFAEMPGWEATRWLEREAREEQAA